MSPFLGRVADVMTAPPWTGESVLGVPEIAAKVVAYESKAPWYVIPRVRREGGYVPGQLAIPPVELWEGYGATPEE